MKNCKEFLTQKGLLVKKVFRVKSKTRKGKYHIVEFLGNGTLRCGCEAGGFKQPCTHKKDKAVELRAKGFIVNVEEQIQ